jgi:hypothetical protein
MRGVVVGPREPKEGEPGVGALQRGFTPWREYYDRNASAQPTCATASVRSNDECSPYVHDCESTVALVGHRHA